MFSRLSFPGPCHLWEADCSAILAHTGDSPEGHKGEYDARRGIGHNMVTGIHISSWQRAQGPRKRHNIGLFISRTVGPSFIGLIVDSIFIGPIVIGLIVIGPIFVAAIFALLLSGVPGLGPTCGDGGQCEVSTELCPAIISGVGGCAAIWARLPVFVYKGHCEQQPA